ncbi:hypothetical protein NDU88_000349 [Pleurodeles waltl]|uniref:Uncharacterized protein n=1 Tax=Pleurodeles waltl TaxID=8319 RepID=A0AAV7KVE2_PLEWA|nr:hypothetical protein NDU88_000349 [Pleurodeles waltl]
MGEERPGGQTDISVDDGQRCLLPLRGDSVVNACGFPFVVRLLFRKWQPGGRHARAAQPALWKCRREVPASLKLWLVPRAVRVTPRFQPPPVTFVFG